MSKHSYPKLGRIQGWKLGTWKELQQSNYSSCPSKVYWGESLKLPNISSYLYLFCFIGTKHTKENFHIIFILLYYLK